MRLKFFNKDTYESLGDAFKAIKQELLSLCPKDSSSVRWQRGADGMSAVVKTGQAASDEGGDVPEESTPQPSGYNGYFTIKDVSTYNEDGTVKEYRVAVCDGETWDPETEKSGDSTLNVNHKAVKVPCQILTDITAGQVYIHYTLKDELIKIEILEEPPIDNSNDYYYLLGDLKMVDKILTIVQRHVCGKGNGEVQLWVTEKTDLPFECFYDSENNNIEINKGFINRNGDFSTAPQFNISPQNGHICIKTSIDDKGVWSDVEAIITNEVSAFNFPIGYCTLTDKGVTVTSFRVPVAFFIVADDCEEVGEKK